MTTEPLPDVPEHVAMFNDSVSRLLRRHPRLGRFGRFPVDAQPDGVAATNGWRFLAGPKFAEYSEDERDGIALHEMMHVLLGHPGRRTRLALEELTQLYRMLLPKAVDAVNTAADYVVNLLVLDAGETLPADALIDEAFADQGFSRVLETVRQRGNPPPPPWGNDIVGNDEADKEETPAPTPDSSPDAPTGGFSEDEATAVLRAVTGRAPPIPVHVWLQRRLLRGTTKRNTWARQSRFGEMVPGRRRARGDSIVFCVDTSGSIDETTAALFRRIGAGIPHAASTTVLFADTRVKARVEDIRNPDEIPAAWAHCAGGGGTQFDDALNEALAYDPSHVIYFTDALGRRTAPPLQCAATWIVYAENGDTSHAEHYAPWRSGETVVFIDGAGHVIGTRDP